MTVVANAIGAAASKLGVYTCICGFSRRRRLRRVSRGQPSCRVTARYPPLRRRASRDRTADHASRDPCPAEKRHVVDRQTRGRALERTLRHRPRRCGLGTRRVAQRGGRPDGSPGPQRCTHQSWSRPTPLGRPGVATGATTDARSPRPGARGRHARNEPSGRRRTRGGVMNRLGTTNLIELRQYLLHTGQRDTLIEVFEREFIETQEAVGMDVLGQFRDLQRPDYFVWLRGFPDMTARHESLTAFYEGPAWAKHSDIAIATMIDTDNVMLLRAVTTDDALPAHQPQQRDLRTPTGLVVVVAEQVEHIDQRAIEEFKSNVIPGLERSGCRTLGVYASEDSTEHVRPASRTKRPSNRLDRCDRERRFVGRASSDRARRRTPAGSPRADPDGPFSSRRNDSNADRVDLDVGHSFIEEPIGPRRVTQGHTRTSASPRPSMARSRCDRQTPSHRSRSPTGSAGRRRDRILADGKATRSSTDGVSGRCGRCTSKYCASRARGPRRHFA